jgi:hypothetical protein
MIAVLTQWLFEHLLKLASNVVVVALVAYLCRGHLSAWLTRSVQHSYDRKLEEQRASNERELTAIRSSLDTQRELVSSVFSEARRDRRLGAIQITWNAMVQISHEAPPIVVMTDMFTTPVQPSAPSHASGCAELCEDVLGLPGFSKQTGTAGRKSPAPRGRVLIRDLFRPQCIYWEHRPSYSARWD